MVTGFAGTTAPHPIWQVKRDGTIGWYNTAYETLYKIVFDKEPHADQPLFDIEAQSTDPLRSNRTSVSSGPGGKHFYRHYHFGRTQRLETPKPTQLCMGQYPRFSYKISPQSPWECEIKWANGDIFSCSIKPVALGATMLVFKTKPAITHSTPEKSPELQK